MEKTRRDAKSDLGPVKHTPMYDAKNQSKKKKKKTAEATTLGCTDGAFQRGVD